MFKLLVYCESIVIRCFCRSQWPRGRRCGSTAARVLGLQVRISPAAWMSVCCECCVLSGIGLCVGLITPPEESCRVWCVWVWSWSFDNEGGPGLPWVVTPCKIVIHSHWPVCYSLSSWQHIMIVFWTVGIDRFCTAITGLTLILGNGMVLHFYQQQESSTTKTVHKVINKGLKTYV